MPAFYTLQNNFTSQEVPAGTSFNLDVLFDTDDDTPLPTGESFQAIVYYDSSLLTFNGSSNELNPTSSGIGGLFQSQIDSADAFTDGDPLTDMRFNATWINLIPGASFPNNASTPGPTLLFTLNFSTIPSFDSGSTNIRTSGFAVTPGMPDTVVATINAVPIPFEFSTTTGFIALGMLFGAFKLWQKLPPKKLNPS